MLLKRRCLIATGLGLTLVTFPNGSVLSQPSTEEEPSELFLSPEQPVAPKSAQPPVIPDPNQPTDGLDNSQSSPSSTDDVSETTAPPLQKLNPDLDLLKVPSKAADEIDLTEPITLQQALELAQRNNLDLRVVELQLQQSRAGLKQAKAADFPILSFQGDISRTDSSIFDLNARPINVDVEAQNEVTGRTLQLLQSQQALGLQALQQDILDLQLRLQQGPDQQQQLVFDQQIQALQLRASTTATPPVTSSVTPLSPLFSFASSGQGSTDGIVSNTLNGALSLTYNVFTSGSRSSTIRAARAQLRLAELTLEAQLEQLRLDVANDYYNLQEAMALIEVAQSTVDNATNSVKDAKALERAGLGTFFDVLQTEVRLADAQQNLTQAKTIERIAQRQLAQRLNVPEAVSLSAADPVKAAGQWPLSLSRSVRLALQNRPELDQILQQRQIAQQQRRASLATIRPQVQTFASLNVQEGLDDDASGTLGYSLGAQVNWNFFDGGAAKAQAAQEDDNIAIAETQFSDTKNILRFQVEQAYSNLQSNFKNISTASNTVNQAQESLRLARLRFQAGIGTQLEITTAETDLTQAQGNLLSAILDYNRALALIQRATSYQQNLESLSQ
jgi:outer membrane factor, OMF family